MAVQGLVVPAYATYVAGAIAYDQYGKHKKRKKINKNAAATPKDDGSSTQRRTKSGMVKGKNGGGGY